VEIKAELVSKNIIRLMKNHNLKQSQLAQMAKMKAEYLNKVIKGKKPLGIQVAVKLARALDCQIEEIIFGEAKQKSLPPTEASLLQALNEMKKELDELRSNLLVQVSKELNLDEVEVHGMSHLIKAYQKEKDPKVRQGIWKLLAVVPPTYERVLFDKLGLL
jgi:transcriptional regulator with XRE-family HTH domain